MGLQQFYSKIGILRVAKLVNLNVHSSASWKIFNICFFTVQSMGIFLWWTIFFISCIIWPSKRSSGENWNSIGFFKMDFLAIFLNYQENIYRIWHIQKFATELCANFFCLELPCYGLVVIYRVTHKEWDLNAIVQNVCNAYTFFLSIW